MVAHVAVSLTASKLPSSKHDSSYCFLTLSLRHPNQRFRCGTQAECCTIQRQKVLSDSNNLIQPIIPLERFELHLAHMKSIILHTIFPICSSAIENAAFIALFHALLLKILAHTVAFMKKTTFFCKVSFLKPGCLYSIASSMSTFQQPPLSGPMRLIMPFS